MIEKIKKLTLRALMSNETLMYGLVLKGGNALQVVYDITERASLDIDFSIKGDFTKEEFKFLESNLYSILNSEFEKEGLHVFDVEFIEKPKQNSVEVWKGYRILFKTIDIDKFNVENMQESRMKAYTIYDNSSTKFVVEISSYEYTESKKKVEVEGVILYVYTPEMIVFEKIRALCQSMPEYKSIIPTARVKGRARDFYDIWNLCSNFEIDFTSHENKEMLSDIFKAKLVPLEFLDLIEKNKDLQKENWSSVEATIPTEKNMGFDFYYDFLL
ncbi:MAG: nucleotidyl transferase AbiEii/AbiGii toxin family protein, partial [Flavobacterium sp.]|uniref:nucleotidyl transferase AbiEii/AbiGii toxin family protein n=1 Tax=Flavobacterium sp. TaxID=239 RepID=UPI003BD0F3CD